MIEGKVGNLRPNRAASFVGRTEVDARPNPCIDGVLLDRGGIVIVTRDASCRRCDVDVQDTGRIQTCEAVLRAPITALSPLGQSG